MSSHEIDIYLASLDQPKRDTLDELRRVILSVVPEVEQCISYGVPAFRLGGRLIAGFAAFKHHLRYFPHSGSVLPILQDEVSGYSTSKGALRFEVDTPLPRELVAHLLAVRINQAFEG